MALPIILPTRTSSDLNSASDINALMTDIEYLYSIIFPVNSFYVQYPAEASNDDATAFPTADEPAELYGGTWTQLYDDEGSFFRTEGTDQEYTENNIAVTARINGLAKDKVQQVLGVISISGGSAYGAIASASGMVVASDPRGYLTGASTAYNLNRTATICNTTSADARVTTATTGKTEPQHRLMKLWRRTA